MQNSMKKFLPVSVTVLFLSLFLLQAVAMHIPSVSISPQEAIIGTETEFKLLVKNQGGTGINTIELILPETAAEQPSYLIREISSPAEWAYVLRYKVGSTSPYKIIWSSTGAGITEGKSLEFSFTAKLPSAVDEFKWTWKTADASGDAATGELATKAILAPFASFKLTAPQSVKAGDNFKITVAAVDKDGKIKTDYTGTVSFASSDNIALLPTEYKFMPTDRGTKEFTVKFKTAGNQTITIKDGTVSLKSDNILVEPAVAVSLKIIPDNSEVKSGDAVDFKATASDIFGNTFDVTGKTKFSIDTEAKGVWVGNFYKSDVEGTWTATANYIFDGRILDDGTTLTVVEEEELEEIGKMNIAVPEEIFIEEGGSTAINLTVKNTGTLDLKDVTVVTSGVPDEWIKISPILSDIAAGKSYDYLLMISVPQNTSGERTIKFSATSYENVSTSKTMALTIGRPPLSLTGLFVAIITNPLYLGIVIVILIIIVLIIWSLLPKEKKKKSEE